MTFVYSSFFFTADNTFVDVLCIAFHEYNLGKMKECDGIDVF